MRIVEFTAENVKKLKAINIKPDGSMVLIAGANGQGKSSILDAIYYALAGTKNLPSQPVRHGEEKAYVKLDLGTIIVTRKFTSAGSTSLTVEPADGSAPKFASPQKLLDEMLGALTFDPLDFSRMDPKKQLETLRGLVKLDVDIDALDQLNAKDYEERTEFNRQLKSVQNLIATANVPEGTPDEIVDVAAKIEQANAISSQNAKSDILAAAITRLNADIETKHRELTELISKRDQHIRQVQDLGPKGDTSELVKEIGGAAAINAAVSKKQVLKANQQEAKRLHGLSENLTLAMEKRDSLKRKTIAEAKYPVDGLSFGNGEVLFNQVPFSQASSAEQLKVAVALAMAANPKLRIIRIKDGSLLDEASLALVEFLAETNDYQVWIERVDTSGLVGIVIEDGSIKEAV